MGAATYSTRGYNVHDGKDWRDSSADDLQDFIGSTDCRIVDVAEGLCDKVEWASGCERAQSWAIRQDRLKVPHLRLPGVESARALPGAVGMFDCWRRGVDVLNRLEDMFGRFDAVIRMRFDLQISEMIEWGRVEEEIARGRLVSPDFCNFEKTKGCNDQLFVAPRDAWVDAMSIHDKLEKYCRDDGVELHPETIFGHHLRACGINTFRMPMDFVIRRTGGGTHDLRRAKG